MNLADRVIRELGNISTRVGEEFTQKRRGALTVACHALPMARYRLPLCHAILFMQTLSGGYASYINQGNPTLVAETGSKRRGRYWHRN